MSPRNDTQARQQHVCGVGRSFGLQYFEYFVAQDLAQISDGGINITQGCAAMRCIEAPPCRRTSFTLSALVACSLLAARYVVVCSIQQNNLHPTTVYL